MSVTDGALRGLGALLHSSGRVLDEQALEPEGKLEAAAMRSRGQ